MPDFAEPWNCIGNVRLRQGKRDEAKDLFKKAITLNNNFAEAHNNLGIALRALGRLQHLGVRQVSCVRRGNQRCHHKDGSEHVAASRSRINCSPDSRSSPPPAAAGKNRHSSQ